MKEKTKMKEKDDYINSQIRLSTLMKKKRKEKHLNRCEKKEEIKGKKRIKERHFKEERKQKTTI